MLFICSYVAAVTKHMHGNHDYAYVKHDNNWWKYDGLGKDSLLTRENSIKIQGIQHIYYVLC